MEFRERLIRTLHALEPILRVPGVMVGGSEVPNLLEPDARSSLVVSQDVDIIVPIEAHGLVRDRSRSIPGFRRSAEEPTILEPVDTALLEVNFIGMPRKDDDSGRTFLYEDTELPLIVFSRLTLLRGGTTVSVDGLDVPVPRVAGLLVEKLLTDRSGLKGDRDLLVALGLFMVATADDRDEFAQICDGLSESDRRSVISGLTTLSLLPPQPGMPDPSPRREMIAEIVRGVERRQ
ncbi:MAG: hypothetical protein EA382_13360 [Spirochaetaceae bacterium]|nr:MAG: hypothetical protein EA382_13360 [Spirochaetaceae bacterium]